MFLHQVCTSCCDLVQNLVYLVQLHHCTKARYAHAPKYSNSDHAV